MREDAHSDDQAQLLATRIQPELRRPFETLLPTHLPEHRHPFETLSPTHVSAATWRHDWSNVLTRPSKRVHIDKRTLKDFWVLSSQAQLWPAWGLVGLAALNAFVVAQCTSLHTC
jgi:hypothetical protein